MRGPGHDHQFLVVTAELLEGILAEVAGMGLFPVDQQDRAADLARIGQQRHVQEGQGRGGVPGTVGVDGTGMEAAPGLVIIEVILDELRLVARQGLGQARGGRCDAAGTCVPGALCVQLLAQRVAGLGIHGVKIAVGRDAAHVVHGDGHGGLDAGIHGGGVQAHAAKTADADDADALRIHRVQRGEEVHRGAEVFGIDVRRGHMTRLAAALARIGGVEGQRQEAAFGHGLGIEPGRLFLHRAKGAAHGQGRQLAPGIPGHVQIARQDSAITGAEGHLAVFHFVAPGKDLVPFLYQFHSLTILGRSRARGGLVRCGRRSGKQHRACQDRRRQCFAHAHHVAPA